MAWSPLRRSDRPPTNDLSGKLGQNDEDKEDEDKEDEDEDEQDKEDKGSSPTSSSSPFDPPNA